MGTDEILMAVGEFFLPPGSISIESLEGGRINETFLVVVSSYIDNKQSRFILQIINQEVFVEPWLIMQNLSQLADYSRSKGIDLVKTKTGQNWYEDKHGNFIRMLNYVDHVTPDITREKISFQSGCVVGAFHKQYWGFPVDQLHEVIKGFHHTPSRYGFFVNSLHQSSSERINMAADEIQYAKAKKQLATYITDPLDKGIISYHVTHNDTKVENILFSSLQKGICLIDFDTVMPGAIAWDVGDSIRSMANSVDEEETDLSKVDFLNECFCAYMSGYASKMRGLLPREEILSLVDGCLVIVYEQGLRFLTDYLQHDKYYDVSYPQQNLIRAKIQFELLKRMLEQRPAMDRVVADLFYQQSVDNSIKRTG
jgi:thiamine kinase-like enzyme